MKILILSLGADDEVADLRRRYAKHDATVYDVAELSAKPAAAKEAALVLAAGAVARRPNLDEAALQLAHQAAQALALAHAGRQVPLCGLGTLGAAVAWETLGGQALTVADWDEAGDKIWPSDAGAKLFQGTEPLRVSASWRWQLGELPRGVVGWAESDGGVAEAWAHKTRPLLALQLMPQDFAYPSDADMVFANLPAVAARPARPATV